MRALTPTAVLLLAIGWILAQGMDQPLWATVVAMLCLGAACTDAMRRRAPGNVAATGLVAILAIVAAAIALVLSLPPGGPGRLLVQLSLVAVLAPVVPIFYALTFGNKDADE